MFHEGEEYKTRDKPTTNVHSPFRIIRNVQVTGEIAIGNRKKERKTGFSAIVDAKIRYCTWNPSRLLCHYRNQLKQDNDFISAFSIRFG